MAIHIPGEALEEFKEFIHSAETNLTHKATEIEHWDKLYEIARVLLQFGHDNEGSLGEYNYKYFISISPRSLYSDITTNTKMFRHLITLYKESEVSQNKDRLFSKKLVDMTGYEFAEFLRQLGITKF